jgi:hypothetical protein
MGKGFYVVNGGVVTHHQATGTPSGELLHAAHILAETFGCPFEGCDARPDGSCPNPQLIHCMLVGLQRRAEGQMCRVCGCTNESPCGSGCNWVETDLCSSCAGWEDVTASVSPLAELEETMGANVAG